MGTNDDVGYIGGAVLTSRRGVRLYDPIVVFKQI